MSIPFDTGYSLADGKLHTRYPVHPTVDVPRRCRTVRAVMALMPDPAPCDICYPPAQEVKREPRKAVSRSGPRTRVPVSKPDEADEVSAMRGGAQEGEGAPPPPAHAHAAGLRTDPPADAAEEDQA